MYKNVAYLVILLFFDFEGISFFEFTDIMGRSHQYDPYLVYGENMPKMQTNMVDLNYDWEYELPIDSNSRIFKERYQKIDKNVLRVCFVCSKTAKGGDNKLMHYKTVFSFNSVLERKLLEHEPKWIEFFRFLR